MWSKQWRLHMRCEAWMHMNKSRPYIYIFFKCCSGVCTHRQYIVSQSWPSWGYGIASHSQSSSNTLCLRRSSSYVNVLVLLDYFISWHHMSMAPKYLRYVGLTGSQPDDSHLYFCLSLWASGLLSDACQRSLNWLFTVNSAVIPSQPFLRSSTKP